MKLKIRLLNIEFFEIILLYPGYSDEMLVLVLFALEDLRNSMKEQGSNLMIRFGSAENVIAELVKEVIFYLFFSYQTKKRIFQVFFDSFLLNLSLRIETGESYVCFC